MTKHQQIKESKNPTVKLIAEDLERVSAISALSDTEGGKLLIKNILRNVAGSIDMLCARYKTLTMQEFIGLCADLNTKLDLARTLKKAKKNKKQAEADLEEALFGDI